MDGLYSDLDRKDLLRGQTVLELDFKMALTLKANFFKTFKISKLCY